MQLDTDNPIVRSTVELGAMMLYAQANAARFGLERADWRRAGHKVRALWRGIYIDLANEGVTPPAPRDYLARFPKDHRASADRAYQDGFADAVNEGNGI